MGEVQRRGDDGKLHPVLSSEPIEFANHPGREFAVTQIEERLWSVTEVKSGCRCGRFGSTKSEAIAIASKNLECTPEELAFRIKRMEDQSYRGCILVTDAEKAQFDKGGISRRTLGGAC